MSDRLFSVPLLANLYDSLDADRSDLQLYVALLEKLGARSVLDIGCGTGTFAVLLARQGLEVIGVDPAAASLDVARRKAGAERVVWVEGNADAAIRAYAPIAALQVDAVTMTGNVAQVFVEDTEWAKTLQVAWQALGPGGHLIFETRNPDAEAWRSWTRESTHRTAFIEDIGEVTCWEEVTEVALTTVSFKTTFVLHRDGSVLTSDSTPCFRHRDEMAAALRQAGFEKAAVYDAPDRPGLEHVFVAQRPDATD